jgi:hypothetical protein
MFCRNILKGCFYEAFIRENGLVRFKATPHKEHLAILHVICLHIFRHLAQKSLDRRQPACTIFAQSDKKSDGASDAQSLCGVALISCKILFV